VTRLTRAWIGFGAHLAALILSAPVFAQVLPGEAAWRSVAERDSVAVRYLFYSEADNVNNGVVLRLDNANSREIHYRLVAIFKSGESRVEETVSGKLAGRTTVTGDADGLFFIPFPDGRKVTQIGVRGLTIRRLPQ
jgi:hypothetical protein